MDLYGRIRHRFGLDDVRPAKLYFSEDPDIQYSTIGMRPMRNYLDVTIIESQITWRLDLPEDLEARTSVKSSSATTWVGRFEEYKMRHEYVAEALSTAKTDVKLKRIFKEQGDAYDNLTPDFYTTDHYGIIHIIELGTDRSTVPRRWIDSYKTKMFKYQEPLMSRATEKPVTFTPIVVSQTAVVSSVPLSQELVDELCLRMLIAVAIEDIARDKGMILERGEEMKKVDKIAEDIMRGLESITPVWSSNDANRIGITKDFYNDIDMVSDPRDLMKDYLECRRLTLEEEKDKKSDQDIVDEYVEDLSSGERRYVKKPVCIMPLMALKKSVGSEVEYHSVCSGEAPEPIKKLWDEALSKASRNTTSEGWSVERLLKEAYEENPTVINELERERLSTRGKHKVVDMSSVLSDSMIKYLSKDGLFGKSAKNDSSNKKRRLLQKQPFHYDTDLSDIDSFLRSTDGFDLLEEIPECQKLPMNLVEESHKLMDNNHFKLDVVKDWMRTKMFHSLDLMTDIATEVTLSLKQNHGSKEMLVKRLRNYNAYLLIKTTNSTSHVFFSIFIPNRNDVLWKLEHPFRPMHKASRGLLTEFVSIKRDKLANFLNASSRFLTLASFWSDFYDVPTMSVDDFIKKRDAVFMLNLSMLISLENKAETEESITQTRYMYMEIFLSTQSRKMPNPFKIVSKLNKMPRSRLNLWCIKRILVGFNLMMAIRPSRLPVERVEDDRGEDTMPGDKWRNLINIYTGEPVNSATAVVNLMYLGYLKDKNQESEGNSEWALVEKILEEECKIEHKRRFEQYGYLPDRLPKGKGFNLNALVHGCEIMEEHLNKVKGPNWKSQLTKDISIALAKHLTHEIATLKAASSIKHNEVKETANLKDQEHVRRVKVIEAMAINADRYGLNPFLNFKAILEYVEKTSEGVICDLFKKQQHGGTREIYVLTSDSRILQLFIETIARELCSNFEEETLTHPENKIKKLDSHKMNACRIAGKRESVFADFCSSSDKTRWNQNFIMTAMCVPLLRMTEEVFHNAIIRVMNLWANKFIKMPPTVVKLLMNKEKLSSETYGRLYDKFHNLSRGKEIDQRLIAQPKSPFMNLTSGMMQGILHYTSSLLHVAFLSSVRKITLSYLKCSHRKKKVRFMMTSVCSSDDSATILTVFSQKKPSEFGRDDIAAFLDCDIALNTMTMFCRLYCMVESVKSTISLYDYVEFNSEFIFKNTLAMPVIKMVAACLTISESESFCRRQYEMYNLISSLSSNGFASLNTYFCQVAQALLHYKTMGSSTSPLFPHLCDKLKILPDIAHGFFLMDKDILTGVAGLSYCRWKTQRSCMMLNAASMLHYSEEADVAMDGTLVDSLTVRHGEHHRWYKLLDRIVEQKEFPSKTTYNGLSIKDRAAVNKELLQDRMDMINSNPIVLYRHPETKDELILKLLSKALNAGVSRSLAKGNPVTQSFSSSSYTLYAHCFTRVSTHKQVSKTEGDTINKMVRKVSLLQSLDDRIKKAEDLIKANSVSVDMEYAFPLSHCYEEIDQVCQSFKDSIFIKTHEMRQKKNFVTLHPRLERLPVSLLQMVGHQWFSFNLKVSNSIIKRCWQSYREKFRWLRDTHTETLAQSPFERHSDLHNFIAAQSQTKRTYMHIGPSVQSERFSHQILQLIRKSTLRNSLLEPMSGVDPKELLKTSGILTGSGSLLREKFESELSLALAIPAATKREEHVSRVLRDIAKTRPSVDDWVNLPNWEMEIGLIALFSTERITSSGLNDAMRERNMGIRISFLKNQEKVTLSDGTIRWEGEGECLVVAEGIQMILNLENDKVMKIRTPRPERLRLRPDLLTAVFSRLNSRASTGTYLPKAQFCFTGTQIVRQMQPGTPVVEDTDDRFGLFDAEDLYLTINSGSVSIMSGVHRPISVVSCRMKPWSCSVAKSDALQPLDDVWEAWVQYRPLKSAKAFKFLHDIEEAMNSKSRLEQHKLELTLNWLSQSLQGRLKAKGIGIASLDALQSLPTTVDDEEMGDEEFMEMMEEFAYGEEEIEGLVKAFGDRIEKEVDQEDINEMMGEDELAEWRHVDFESLMNFDNRESPFRAVINNWMGMCFDVHASVLASESKDMYPLHPMWDELISDILKSVDPRWFMKVLGGVVPSSERKIAKLLIKVLRVKQAGEEKDLWDRYLSTESESATSLLD